MGGIEADVLMGGAGDDVLVWDVETGYTNNRNVSNISYASTQADTTVDGGDGFDTLWMGGDSRDFTRTNATVGIDNIELIDLRDRNASTVVLDAASVFEMTDESIEIPDKLAASIRVISMGNVPAPGSFDPTGVNWETVDSQIFWLNLLIDRDPCRLEISGFPAIRRMPSGRGSGFVKWPAGAWRTDIVAERTNTKLATDGFSLSAKANIGLISSGGGKFSHRLLTLEGRPPVKSEAPMATRIRFANALPDGVVGSTIPFTPEPVLLTLKPGECSEIFQPEKGRFPGAALNLTIGNLKNKVITKIPAMPSLPQGDWVVIIHLNQESFDAPVITWVEMDKGMIIEPSKQGGEE
jgi:hypothetical protein